MKLNYMFEESLVGLGVVVAAVISGVQSLELMTLEGSFLSSESIYKLHIESDGTGF